MCHPQLTRLDSVSLSFYLNSGQLELRRGKLHAEERALNNCACVSVCAFFICFILLATSTFALWVHGNCQRHSQAHPMNNRQGACAGNIQTRRLQRQQRSGTRSLPAGQDLQLKGERKVRRISLAALLVQIGKE